jgi:hypothetical protein
MTSQQHIDLLTHLYKLMRSHLEAAVPGGGELWDGCANAKRIEAAIRSLREDDPNTLDAVAAVNAINAKVQGRGPKHYARFEDRAAALIQKGNGIHRAMGISLAYEDALCGLDSDMRFFPAPVREGYEQGKREATEAMR